MWNRCNRAGVEESTTCLKVVPLELAIKNAAEGGKCRIWIAVFVKNKIEKVAQH